MAPVESAREGGVPAARASAGPPTHENRWTGLRGNAEGAIKKRRYREAAEFLEEALYIAEAAWPDGARYSETAVRLAGVCVMLSLHGRAEALYRQTLLAGGESADQVNAVFVEALSGLGRLYLLREEFDKAEPLIRRALDLETALRGPGLASVPVFLNLAMLHAMSGRDEDAGRMFGEAVETLERGERGDEVEAIEVYDNAALFHIGRGDLAVADSLYRRALILRQETGGPRHPVYAAGLVNLGRLQFQRGVFDEAETLLWQAADVFHQTRRASYSGHLPALYYLALMAQRNQQHEEAEMLRAKLLQDTETDPEANGPARAAVLHLEGRNHLARGEAADAGRKFREALDIAGDSNPVHRRFTAAIRGLLLGELAGLPDGGGQPAEAERLAAEARELAGALDWSLGRRVFTAG